jgi:hypothetical protein
MIKGNNLKNQPDTVTATFGFQFCFFGCSYMGNFRERYPKFPKVGHTESLRWSFGKLWGTSEGELKGTFRSLES